MTDEKPLRVRVAEALTGQPSCVCGEADQGFDGHTGLCLRCGNRPAPPYGYDSPNGWAATGPLLKGLGHVKLVGVQGIVPLWVCAVGDGPPSENRIAANAEGRSPCEAIARCVVALAAAGKLPR